MQRAAQSYLCVSAADIHYYFTLTAVIAQTHTCASQRIKLFPYMKSLRLLLNWRFQLATL